MSTNQTTCWYFDYLTDQNLTTPCNNINGSANLLSGTVEFSDYGYLLNHGPTYAFLALYSALTFAHVSLGVYWRTWWTLPTLALGCLVEVIGWCGRLQSITELVWDPNNRAVWTYVFGEFVMQLCCLVIAPTFFSAANYVLLGYLMGLTDPRYSTLDLRSVRVIFITSDVLCLLIQAGGGAWAGIATNGNNGGKLMTGGVILQLVVTVIFIGIYAEWLNRWRHDRPVERQYRPLQGKASRRQSHEKEISSANAMSPLGPRMPTTQDPESGSHGDGDGVKRDTHTSGTVPVSYGERDPFKVERRVKMMAAMIAFSSLLIVVRSVYRSIELLNGWSGRIETNEPLFLGMDATMMFILVFSYAIVHPGLAVGRRLF